MRCAISLMLGFVSVIGYTSVRGQDYFDLMRADGSTGDISQRSASASKIDNVTISRSSKLARLDNAAYTDHDFYDSASNSPHVIDDADCKGRTPQIYAMGRKAMCNPRPTLVKLNPDPGYEYTPNIVILQRCKGPCGHPTQSCMVLESTLETIYLKRKQKVNGLHHMKPECVKIDVAVHTRCKCGCDLMASSCNKRQKYYPEACECNCRNFKEQFICDMKDNMEWDPQTCRCNCKMEEEICSTGLVWVPTICKCAQIMDNSLPLIG